MTTWAVMKCLFQHERNAFVERMQRVAQDKHLRISFLSGNANCAAVGVFKTYVKGKQSKVLPPIDYRYMLNIVSSECI